MIVSVSQPYFAPFPGFFHKIIRSDIFVLLDTVQFPRGFTWITRNRFKNDQGTLWMSIPVVRKGRGLQPIHQVEICRDGNWAAKHLRSLETAYRHAPYQSAHIPVLRKLFRHPPQRLVDLNLTLIQYLIRCLGIDTRVMRLSDMGIRTKGQALLLDICVAAGATRFLAQKSAGKFLDADRFRKAGIPLELIHIPTPVYPQLWGDFIPNLSVFDLLFTCGPAAGRIVRAQS